MPRRRRRPPPDRCTPIDVEREGELLTDRSPEFTNREADTLVVAGTDDARVEFSRLAR